MNISIDGRLRFLGPSRQRNRNVARVSSQHYPTVIVHGTACTLLWTASVDVLHFQLARPSTLLS